MEDPMGEMSPFEQGMQTGYDQAIAGQRRRISELESALREIAEHPHCQDGQRFCSESQVYRNIASSNCEKAYAKGCEDGHRCAAETARKALEGK